MTSKFSDIAGKLLIDSTVSGKVNVVLLVHYEPHNHDFISRVIVFKAKYCKYVILL